MEDANWLLVEGELGSEELTMVDPDTGECFFARQKKDVWNEYAVYDKDAWWSERWELQRVVRRVMPGSRVAQCLRVRVAKQVKIRRFDGGVAQVHGVQRCGSVWLCPVCAARIAEERRRELAQGLANHEGGVAMVTYTIPHREKHGLFELVHGLCHAMRAVGGGDAMGCLRRETACVGTVRGLEVTHGPHTGWHPHFHELWFTGKGSKREALETVLPDRWAAACRRAGLGTPGRHGVWVSIVRSGEEEQAVDYITKWGADRELAKSVVKRGKPGRDSPWDLLRRAAKGEGKAEELFQEYGEGIKGRHQLQWGRGLRARLGVGSGGEEGPEWLEDVVLAQGLWGKLEAAGLGGAVLRLARKDGAELKEFLSNVMKWAL